MSEAGGCDRGRRTSTLDIFGMKFGQVLMTENRAKCQQVGIPIQHDPTIDSGYSLQYGGRKSEHSFLMEQIVELVLRSRKGRWIAIGQRRKQVRSGNKRGDSARIFEHYQQAAPPIFCQVQG